MITIVHGGQTGVDRGAHEAAVDSGYRVAGYMPRDARDELGPIPEAVARFLVPHDKTGYGARTEANVASADAALIVVRDSEDPRASPGTALTIDLAARRQLPRMVVDPTTEAIRIARWICGSLLASGTLLLPLDGIEVEQCVPRLLVAGPRESRWRGARAATEDLLRRVIAAVTEIRSAVREEDLARQRR